MLCIKPMQVLKLGKNFVVDVNKTFPRKYHDILDRFSSLPLMTWTALALHFLQKRIFVGCRAVSEKTGRQNGNSVNGHSPIIVPFETPHLFWKSQGGFLYTYQCDFGGAPETYCQDMTPSKANLGGLFWLVSWKFFMEKGMSIRSVSIWLIDKVRPPPNYSFQRN